MALSGHRGRGGHREPRTRGHGGGHAASTRNGRVCTRERPGPEENGFCVCERGARPSGGRGARGSRRGSGTAACRPLWLMFWGTVGPGCPLLVLSSCPARGEQAPALGNHSRASTHPPSHVRPETGKHWPTRDRDVASGRPGTVCLSDAACLSRPVTPPMTRERPAGPRVPERGNPICSGSELPLWSEHGPRAQNPDLGSSRDRVRPGGWERRETFSLYRRP